MSRLGGKKLHYLLKEGIDSYEVSVGRDKLFTILRQEGLLIVKRKNYTVTTNSKHGMLKYPNRVRSVALIRPEQVWVAAITYLNTGNSNFATSAS